MEIYNTDFPENVHNIILVASKDECKSLLLLLLEYQRETKSSKKIQDVCHIISDAKEGNGICYLNNPKVKVLHEAIEKYSDMKEKSKRHKVHKYRKLFDDWFMVY